MKRIRRTREKTTESKNQQNVRADFASAAVGEKCIDEKNNREEHKGLSLDSNNVDLLASSKISTRRSRRHSSSNHAQNKTHIQLDLMNSDDEYDNNEDTKDEESDDNEEDLQSEYEENADDYSFDGSDFVFENENLSKGVHGSDGEGSNNNDDDYNEDKDDDDSIEMLAKTATAGKKRRKSAAGTTSTKEQAQDVVSSETATEATPATTTTTTKKKRQRTSASTKSDNDIDENDKAKSKRKRKKNDFKDLSCMHCHRIFTSSYGLKYHLKRQVCLRLDGQGGAGIGHVGGIRLSGTGKNVDNDDEATLIRKSNSLPSRLIYNIPPNVQKKMTNKEGKVPFLPIRPGVRFVIQEMGGMVVEVINDNRIPNDYGTTCVSRKDTTSSGRLQTRKCRAKLAQRKRIKMLHVQLQKGCQYSKYLTYDAEQHQHLVLMSSHLYSLYQKHNAHTGSQSLPPHHYFSSTAVNLRAINGPDGPPENKSKVESYPPDRGIPPDSYPDRIVECIVIPDERIRIGSKEYNEESFANLMSIKNKKKSATINTSSEQKDNSHCTKIFIKRCLLTTLYVPEVPLFICDDCGKKYNTAAGIKLHMDASCTKSWSMITDEYIQREIKSKEINQSKIVAAEKTNMLLQQHHLHQQQQEQETQDEQQQKKQRILKKHNAKRESRLRCAAKRALLLEAEEKTKKKKAEEQGTVEESALEKSGDTAIEKERGTKFESSRMSNGTQKDTKPAQLKEALKDDDDEGEAETNEKESKGEHQQDEEDKEEYLPPAAKALFHVEYDKNHPSRRIQTSAPVTIATIATFIPQKSSMYHSVLLTLGSLLNISGAKALGTTMTKRKRKGIDFTKVHVDIQTTTAATTATATTPSNHNNNDSNVTNHNDKINQNEGTATSTPAIVLNAKPEKAKRISNRQGLFVPRVCEDINAIIKEIDTGRFPSLQRFYGNHSDECCVPYCKATSTLYCCEFCSNVSHAECLERKVVVKNLDVNGDFMCHTCLRSILSRLQRQERRLKKRAEDEKVKKYVYVPKPVRLIRSVDPMKLEPSRTGLFPQAYVALGFIKKGFQPGCHPGSVIQKRGRKRNSNSSSMTNRRTISSSTKKNNSSERNETVATTAALSSSINDVTSITPYTSIADNDPFQKLLMDATINGQIEVKDGIGVYPPPKTVPQLPEAVAPVIIDTSVLAEEIHAGRYPSMGRYLGQHDSLCVVCKVGNIAAGTSEKQPSNDSTTDHGNQELLECEFCLNSEHMSCLKSRVVIQDIDLESGDDFMCHKCIQTVVARRVRAEGRRLEKRSEALEKAGISSNNAFYNANSTLSASATAGTGGGTVTGTLAQQQQQQQQKEVEWSTEHTFESHEVSFDPCPFGGLGGLVCCAHCSDVYSRFLSETSKEMEVQTLAKIGREVSEMMELLKDSKLRLQQSIEVAEANDIKRRLMS